MLPASSPELLYRIALTMAPGIGPVTARKLMEKAGSARAVFQMPRSSLEKIPGIGQSISASLHSPALMDLAEKEMGFMERYSIAPLNLGDPGYPRLLKECPDAPLLLYSKGQKGLSSKRALSVVGTRRASGYGKEQCRSMVLELGSLVEDLVIISGLAYGIDVMAHRAALEAGIPTIAVLGHGLSTIYPQAHRETAGQICKQGALVTDFPSGMGPERNNFLRRNRIIAGLAYATLVVESPSEGGALITARLASSYDREVLALPGRSTDERSRGCNHLIKRQVAAMVESAGDIISQLNWTEHTREVTGAADSKKELEGRQKQLYEILSEHGTLSPEDLCRFTGASIQEVLGCLTELELKGWISSQAGNLYRASAGLH